MSVRCMLCGEEFETLASHLRMHGVTSNDYRKMFPGAELMSRELRQRVVESNVGKHDHDENERRLMSEHVCEGLAAMSPEAKALMGKHISESLNNMSDEAKAGRGRKISEANTGLVRTEEQCQHYSEASSKRWKDPEYKQRMRDVLSRVALTRPLVSAETRQRASKTMTEKWREPGYRERVSAKCIETWSDPELRKSMGAKVTESLNVHYASSEGEKHKEAIREALTGRPKSEEHVERMRESQSRRIAEEQRNPEEYVKKLLIRRAQKYAEFSGLTLPTEVEEYITLFCEGDGHVGLEGAASIPKVSFAQERTEREPLDYIASLVPNSCFDEDREDNVLTLTYHGAHCMPLLEMFSRHVVGRTFLGRLNPVLAYALLPEAVQHPITPSGLVGFWDAEGTSSNAPYISIAQKDREILDLICAELGGSVYCVDGRHNWTLCGDEARKLAGVLLEKSHCPQRVERLRENFEGPSYYDLNKEKVQAHHHAHSPEYDKKRYEKQKLVRAYMKEHPEIVRGLNEKVH